MLEISRVRDSGAGAFEKAGNIGDQVAVYCRVSSHEQKAKGDLGRQVEAAKAYCIKQGFGFPRVFTDVGSGLNTRRSGLKRLCREIEDGMVATVVVTFKDRLTRFGFDYLRSYFSSHGTRIIVARQAGTKSLQEDLVDDLIAIITSFSGRVHGMRGHHGSKINADTRVFEKAVKRECDRAWRRVVASVLS